MTSPRKLHPWVKERRDTISFAVQPIASKDDPQGPALVGVAKQIDDLGYDAIFLSDHPTWAPDPYLHLAVMALQTKRVFLGPMVAAAPYRNPSLYARLISDLDHLSGGRAVNGFGIGWNAAEWDMGVNEFDRMGLDYSKVPERQAALEELLTIVRGSWGGEPFTFNGEHYRADRTQVPAPVQQPEPPVVIAGAGKNTFNQLARLGDMANFGSGPSGQVDGVAEAAQRLEVLHAQCEAVGRPYEDLLRSHFIHWLLLAPDAERLDAKVKHYFPDGISGFWGKGLIAHTVESAVDYFSRYRKIGINYVVFQVLDVHDEETLHLAAEQVIPRVKEGR